MISDLDNCVTVRFILINRLHMDIAKDMDENDNVMNINDPNHEYK